jgi:hypothetical protein
MRIELVAAAAQPISDVAAAADAARSDHTHAMAIDD